MLEVGTGCGGGHCGALALNVLSAPLKADPIWNAPLGEAGWADNAAQVEAEFMYHAAFRQRGEAPNPNPVLPRGGSFGDGLRCVGGECWWWQPDFFTWGPDVTPSTQFQCTVPEFQDLSFCHQACADFCAAEGDDCGGWCFWYGTCYLRPGPTGGVASVDLDSWCAPYCAASGYRLDCVVEEDCMSKYGETTFLLPTGTGVTIGNPTPPLAEVFLSPADESSPSAESISECYEVCSSMHFCCNDITTGSAGFLSCAQACAIRVRGASQHTCASLCVSASCSHAVGGHNYYTCSSCADCYAGDSQRRPWYKQGEQGGSRDACLVGCAVGPPPSFSSPSSSPPTPPPQPPSPHSPAMPWKDCTATELAGDFNGRGGFTASDAIYVARMWAGAAPLSTCMGMDLDQNGRFDLNDATFVAWVWAGEKAFPWWDL